MSLLFIIFGLSLLSNDLSLGLIPTKNLDVARTHEYKKNNVNVFIYKTPT